MIVLFGTKAYREVLAVVTLICQFCGNPAAQRIEKVVTKFTLFFIPTFTVSTRHTMQCAACGQTSTLDKAAAESLAK